MASPRTIQALTSVILQLDSRPILPLVQAPTLVPAKQGFPVIPREQARYLAEHLPHAKLVELAGTDALLVWETHDPGTTHPQRHPRHVAAVAITRP